MEDNFEKADLTLRTLMKFRDTYLDYRSRLSSYFKGEAPPIEWEFNHEMVFGRYDVYVGRLTMVVVS